MLEATALRACHGPTTETTNVSGPMPASRLAVGPTERPPRARREARDSRALRYRIRSLEESQRLARQRAAQSCRILGEEPPQHAEQGGVDRADIPRGHQAGVEGGAV